VVNKAHQNPAGDEDQESQQTEVQNDSRPLKHQPSDLRSSSRELRRRSRALLAKVHRHRCMSCNAHWDCEAILCELKYLCLCLECHRKIGSI
jgi:hypothetical protein